MKTKSYLFVAAFLLAVSCEENSNAPFSKSIEGTWIIKKSLADPGDGSGRYTNVSGSPTITFYSGGSASSNSGYFGLGMLKSYEVMDSTSVQFFFKEQSSQPKIIFRYSFSGDTLILNPPCIEGCGLKLVRE